MILGYFWSPLLNIQTCYLLYKHYNMQTCKLELDNVIGII